MREVSFTYLQNDENRVDKYFDLFGFDSRSEFQSLIKDGNFFVNGKKEKQNYKFRENDIVKIRYYDMILIRKEKHDAVIQMKNMAYAERVSLGEMEKRLPPQFVRCHKSYIINIMYVDSIVGSLIYMADGTQIVAGRKYLADVRKELLDFAQK